MTPSQNCCLMVALAVVTALAAVNAHVGDRPKLPRGAPCWQCGRAQNRLPLSPLVGLGPPHDPPAPAPAFYVPASEDGAEGAVAVAAAAAADQPEVGDGFSLRLARLAPLERSLEHSLEHSLERQGRSGAAAGGPGGPFWPLRHPALALDARKRHRVPEFQHPNVRFVNNHYFNDLGLGGPYGGGGDDSWEEPKPMTDNRIRDRSFEKAGRLMTAEELIQALREKGRQGRQGRDWGNKEDDDDDSRAVALRFGSLGKK